MYCVLINSNLFMSFWKLTFILVPAMDVLQHGFTQQHVKGWLPFILNPRISFQDLGTNIKL